ncbi:DUF2786 domain-containing protein [Mycobacterium sp.]|uniref:DUF2786 domain-containing protein n=1 Tax=Mycobacterium sp. TaxID=1785 RepID=UPI0031DBF890
MSRRNREKRAAKLKNRRRAEASRERVRSGPGPDRVMLLERLVFAFSAAASCPDGNTFRRVAAELLDEYQDFASELDTAADIVVNEAIEAAWRHGWTPSDLHEVARRRLKAAEVRYLDEAVVLESRRYAAAALHPQWRAALADISTTLGPAAHTPHMWGWAAANGVGRSDAVNVVLTVLHLLGRLPVLTALLPLPGTFRQAPTAVSDIDDKALGKVRALLAKAEATDFADEAEALSAKAQELMSRYSLQEAVAGHDPRHVPLASARRIWIDNPYAAAKAVLVQVVGRANRCRAVWAEDIGFITVIASETDLRLVELLATSLLVQANRAMLGAGRQITGGEQARTRSFRQTFLVAYAQRIGERLESVSASVTAEIKHDARLLPVLAANSRAADELTDRMFPSTVPRPVAASNGAGWGAGRAAADMAVLDVRDGIAG